MERGKTFKMKRNNNKPQMYAVLGQCLQRDLILFSDVGD